MLRLFLGVDGGQSTTKALIGDENGRVLGAGVGGPCNHVGAAEGAAKLTRAVRECVGNACNQARLDPERVEFTGACFGMSGGPEDKEQLLRELLRAEQLVVTNDALIALAGATAGEPGILAYGGTGSIAFGRNANGATARAGGWGYVFGDEGGGFDIARQAMRAALRFEEGWGPPTILRESILRETGGASANEALHRWYTTEFPRPRIAAFSKFVDAAAAAGDDVARKILANAAQQLALLVAAIRAQLWAADEPATVAYAGGVFRSQPLFERFRMLVEMEVGNHCQAPIYDPAAGALFEAYRTAGLRPVKLEY